MQKLLAIFSCLILHGCMVGPNYKEPHKLTAGHWIDKNKAVKEAPIQNANWWTVFKDPILTSLILHGYHNNLSLQQAGVRVLQARAQLAQSVGELYPQQQALMGNLNYNRIGGSQFETVLPTNFYTAILGATATWELDFWGKYRRAILSNDAAFLASYAAYDNALVTLTADIATAYVTIRTLEELISVTKKNIRVQDEGFNIASTRYREGQTSELDVEQAKTELSQTQSSLPKLVSDLRRQKDLLGVLLGVTPNCVDGLLGKKKSIPTAPSSIAVGIPMEAIAKRPDVYQARMEAIAQLEAIGAAKANLYPSISLAGTFALASNTIGSNSLGQLLNLSNRTITAGPLFNWSILNYGQITNAVRAQDAVFQQALLSYQNLVLQAQQEIQDNITQFIEMQKAERYLKRANRSAKKSTHLALVRYREGESDFTPVLDAERQQLQVEKQLVAAQGDIPKAVIALYRALGGGWQIRGCNDVVPFRIKEEMKLRTNWGGLLATQHHQPPTTKLQQIQERYLPVW